MKIYNISLNSIKRRKSKSILLMIGLVLPVAAVIILLTVSNKVNEHLEINLDEFGANIIITPKTDEMSFTYAGISFGNISYNSSELRYEDISKIRTIKNKENINIVSPKLIKVLQINSEEILTAGVIFEEELRLKKWWKINGKQSIAKGEVLVGEKARKKLGLIKNQKLNINGKNYDVAGIIEPTGSQDDEMVFVSLDEMQLITGEENTISLVEVAALCYDCPIEEIVRQISEKIPNSEIKPLKQQIESKMAAVSSFESFSMGVSIIILLTSILIVFSNINSSVIERTREIGIFKALGFRNADIAKIFMIEILLISFFSGIIGYIIAYYASQLFVPLLTNDREIIISWDFTLIISAIIISIGVAGLSSIVPIYKAISLDPVVAFRAL